MIRINGKERFLGAIEKKHLDRVPAMELIVDASVCKALCGSESYYDLVEQYEYFDLAVCTAGVVYPGEYNWVDKGKKIFRDKWGVAQQFTNQFLPHVVGDPPIRSLDDLQGYAPPDPGDESILRDAREAVRRFSGSRAVGFLGEDVFSPAQSMLGGPENLFIALKLEPELIKAVVKLAEEYHVALYKNVMREGVDVVLLGDDYGTSRAPMISPGDFEEFFLPSIARIADTVHEFGGRLIKHTDGNVWPLLPGLERAGVDVFGPLQHECGMHLDKVREAHPGVAVIGNVPVDLLIQGTPQACYDAAAECIGRLAPYRGHILSSGNSITREVPPKNLLAMMRAAKDTRLP